MPTSHERVLLKFRTWYFFFWKQSIFCSGNEVRPSEVLAQKQDFAATHERADGGLLGDDHGQDLRTSNHLLTPYHGVAIFRACITPGPAQSYVQLCKTLFGACSLHPAEPKGEVAFSTLSVGSEPLPCPPIKQTSLLFIEERARVSGLRSSAGAAMACADLTLYLFLLCTLCSCITLCLLAGRRAKKESVIRRNL